MDRRSQMGLFSHDIGIPIIKPITILNSYIPKGK